MDENSNNYEAVSSIEAVDSLFDNLNKNSFSNNINQNITDENVNLNNVSFSESSSIQFSLSRGQKFLNFFLISFYMFIYTISFLFIFISTISIIFEIGISFYSVIMMNYVFFVSSIVSYTMAPLYQSLSHDWLNFVFSFTQVILASPLIAFYIFYILKTVVSLAEFISDIPTVIKHVFSVVNISFKDAFKDAQNAFFNNYYSDTRCSAFCEGIVFFLISLLLLLIASVIAYVLFCFDKTIILIGIICYVINTIQILFLIFPSYIYFFRTLFNMKCKEIKCVKKYINTLNEFMDFLSNEMEMKPSSSSESSDLSNSKLFKQVSDESDSVIKIKFDENNFQNSNDKMIDDPFIEKYVDEIDEVTSIFFIIFNMLFQIFIADNYYSLYYYSKSIAFDKHKKCLKISLMYIFLALNLAVISYDIYKLTQNYSGYFLASIIIRFIFIPLFSYYNIFVLLFYKPKDQTLKIILNISSVFTILIAFTIIVCFAFTGFYQSKYRINNLEYVPVFDNITIANKKMLDHPICNYEIFGVTPIDAFGYSLGGYDIKRNKTIFENQMKIFFDQNYSNRISYTLYELDEYFLFIKYFDSSINTHIFAFRGYNSGPEVAFQLEALATYYIIPFFEDIVPFYETINEYWLGFYTDFLNSFGLRFFENDNLMVKYVNKIIDIYDKSNLDDEKVLFAGINCGGVIAKIVGTLLKRKSISFLSLPIDNDLFSIMFDFSSSYISFVTNIYNVDGFFSDQEPRYANNIGVEIPVFNPKKYCTSDICDIYSKIDNVYRTFCTISEICGKGNRFHYYCENTIGEKDLETIRETLKEKN